MSSHHVIVPLPGASAPERARVQAVQVEVRSFLDSDLGGELPDPGLASLAVHGIYEILPNDGVRYDFEHCSYARLLDWWPTVSRMHPTVAEYLLAVWGTYALYLHDTGRIGADTLERLHRELSRGADTFVDRVVTAYLAAVDDGPRPPSRPAAAGGATTGRNRRKACRREARRLAAKRRRKGGGRR